MAGSLERLLPEQSRAPYLARLAAPVPETPTSFAAHDAPAAVSNALPVLPPTSPGAPVGVAAKEDPAPAPLPPVEKSVEAEPVLAEVVSSPAIELTLRLARVPETAPVAAEVVKSEPAAPTLETAVAVATAAAPAFSPAPLEPSAPVEPALRVKDPALSSCYEAGRIADRRSR